MFHTERNVIRTCRFCGKEFETNSRRRKHCYDAACEAQARIMALEVKKLRERKRRALAKKQRELLLKGAQS